MPLIVPKKPRRNAHYPRSNRSGRGLGHATDAAAVHRECGRIAARLTTTDERLDELQREEGALVLQQAQAGERRDDLAQELASLRNQSSAIPRRQLELRRKLCEDLGLKTEELPYAGELIQVRESAADWEGVIERIRAEQDALLAASKASKGYGYEL